MIKSKLLLLQKLSTIQKSKRKDYLIDCINKNNIIKFDDDEFLDESIPKKDININFCKICNENNFIRDKFSEICKNCGYVRLLPPTEKVFEKIEYIKPGSNLVKIIKDSKKITVDLNKINLWIQDSDPLANDTQKIIDNLNMIYQGRGMDLPNNVQNSAISLWYNFNTLYIESLKKKNYNKKAILCLCIYYGSSIHGYTISLQQLSLLFDINVSEIIITNTFFKDIFKDTEYLKFLSLHEQKNCEIELSPKNKLIFNKIKKDLLKYFSNISEPLSNKEYAAIVYFITNKINTTIKFTLKQLEEKCNISTTSISNISKSIEKFYKNNPKIYKELLV